MIKILIDTASDITMQEAQELGINAIPIEVRFGNESFLDGFNLSHKKFFEKLIESDDFPQTSQINEFRFEEEFKKLTKNGDEVICITLSSKLSGTYNCALAASKSFQDKVFVVDSLNATIGERILCELALRLIKEGKTAKEIVEQLNKQKQRIKLLAVLDTLKYLKKGGRISPLVALTGEVFSIKPVVSVVDGEVKLVGKAIGSKKGNNLLMQFVEKCGIDFDMPFALAYSGLNEDFLNRYLIDSKKIWNGNVEMKDIPSYMIGSTIGTHVGPGAIAVSFFAKEC